tara:strand:- start:8041 stop:8784 length:744 start_codon:yes stop_codon:yes gene_type:complete
MTTIYIFQLESDKFFVSKIPNPKSEWVRKYKKVKIYDTIYDCNDYDVTKYTISYMNKYGVENVRGGIFEDIKLNEEQIIMLNTMLKSYEEKLEKNKYLMKDSLNKYLESVNKDNIENKISNVHSIFNEIKRIYELIKHFDFISYDDIKKLEKESKNLKNNQDCLSGSYIDRTSMRYQIESKYNILKKILKISNYDYELSTLVKGLQILEYNLKNKKKLEDIYKEYHSEEFILKLIEELYKLKIKMYL